MDGSGSLDGPRTSRLAAEGVELAMARWGPDRPSRGTVVVVHGLKDHGRRYGDLARRLVAEGFAVAAADLRGHGSSGGDRQYVASFAEYVDDLDRVLAEAAPPGTGPRFVLAHSMGGAIAVRWVLERSPDLAGVVLSAPALRSPPRPGAGARMIVRFLGRVAPRAPVFRPPFENFSRDATVVAAMRADPLIDAAGVPARTMAELLRSMAWSERRFQQFRVPLLALHGTEDRLTDPSGSQALVRAATGPVHELRSYPGLYHDLLHEPEREVVLADILGWLGERSAAG